MRSNNKTRTHCQENHIFCSTGNKCMSSESPERLYLKSYRAWVPKERQQAVLCTCCVNHAGVHPSPQQNPAKPPLGDCGVGFSLSVGTGQWQHPHDASRNTRAGASTSIPSQRCTAHDAPARASPSVAQAASSPPGASWSCMNSEAAGHSICSGSLTMLSMGKPLVAPYSSCQAQGRLIGGAAKCTEYKHPQYRAGGSFRMPWI